MKILNSKFEARKSKQYLNSKTKKFKFKILDLFRISDFGFRISSKAGFTLLELLIALTLMTVVVAGSMSVLIIFLRARGEVIATGEVNQNARVALTAIEKSLHTAQSVVSATGSCADSCLLVIKNSAWATEGGTTCGSVGITCYQRYAQFGYGRLLQCVDTTNCSYLTSTDVDLTSFTYDVLLNGTRNSVNVKMAMKYNGQEQSKYSRTAEGAYELR